MTTWADENFLAEGAISEIEISNEVSPYQTKGTLTKMTPERITCKKCGYHWEYDEYPNRIKHLGILNKSIHISCPMCGISSVVENVG